MDYPLGKFVVAVPGTLVRATSQEDDPTLHVPCHAVKFQALPTNVGKVYIGDSTLNRAAMTGVDAWLPEPVSGTAPSYSVALTIAPNALGLNRYYIDADNANDGVIITVLRF